MPTINQRRLVASLLGAALAAALPTAFAKEGDRVQAVVADAARGVLTIHGAFPGASRPAVYLGGHASPLDILSRSAISLEVQLPSGIARGNHHLVVGEDEAFAFTLGPVGPQGDAGATGATGPVGMNGPRGDDAALPAISPLAAGSECLHGGTRVATREAFQFVCNGEEGPAGADGTAGLTGAPGPQGTIGIAGLAGPMGPRGPKGDDGVIGPLGPQGLAGDSGPQGNPGFVGWQGQWGPQGPRGPQGPQGVSREPPSRYTGPPGMTGPRGEQGTFGQHAMWFPGGSMAVAHDAETTIATFAFNPGHNWGQGDVILRVDAMGVMTAPWAGCAMSLRFVIDGLGFASLPASRYMPRNVPRHLSYAVAVPNLPAMRHDVRVVATSDCPETRLTRISMGGQWLNRLP